MSGLEFTDAPEPEPEPGPPADNRDDVDDVDYSDDEPEPERDRLYDKSYPLSERLADAFELIETYLDAFGGDLPDTDPVPTTLGLLSAGLRDLDDKQIYVRERLKEIRDRINGILGDD